jgi:hypothetical protein
MRRPRVIAFVLAASLAGGLLPASPASAHALPVYIRDSGLDPMEQVVDMGHGSMWTNLGLMPRRVVEDTFGLFESPTLFQDDSFTYDVAAAGSFPYRAEFPLGAIGRLDGTLTVRPVFGTGFTSRGFQIVWGLAGHVPDGLAFQAQLGVFRQLHEHRVGGWRWLARGTRAASGWMPFSCDGRGRSVRVRSRLADGTVSGWAESTGIVCVDHVPRTAYP